MFFFKTFSSKRLTSVKKRKFMLNLLNCDNLKIDFEHIFENPPNHSHCPPRPILTFYQGNDFSELSIFLNEQFF